MIDSQEVVRNYTPSSLGTETGYFELIVKVLPVDLIQDLSGRQALEIY